MRIRYVECCVVRDPMMKIPKSVPAWEFPMLNTVYGNIEDVKEFIMEDAAAPLPPEDELARVTRLYGREKRDDGSAGDYWAHVAYGRGRDGFQRIESLIRDSIVEDPESDSDSAESTKGKRGRRKAGAAQDDGE